MKILILSADREMYSAAAALYESSRERGAACEIVRLSSFYTPSGSKYKELVFRTKAALSSVYPSYDPMDREMLGRLGEYIARENVDCVVAADARAVKAASAVRKRFPCVPKFYGLLTDAGAAQGVSGEGIDGFFIPHSDMADKLREKGIEGEFYPTGMPVEKGFFRRFTKKAARNYLAIDENTRVYMLLSQGIGYEEVRDVCDEMLKVEKEGFLFYVFVDRGCEKGELLRRRYQNSTSVQIITVNKHMDIYRESADVILTRPEGYENFEAAAAGVPLVHLMTVRGPAATAEFFSSHEMSLLGNTVSDTVRKARRLIDEKALSRRMIRRQSMLVGLDAADKILDKMISNNAKTSEVN